MAEHEGFFKWTFGKWPYWTIGGLWFLMTILLDPIRSIGYIVGVALGTGLVLLIPFFIFWIIWFKVLKK